MWGPRTWWSLIFGYFNHVLEIFNTLFKNKRNILVILTSSSSLLKCSWIILLCLLLVTLIRLHFYILVVIRHIYSLWLRQINILCWLIVFLISTRLCSLWSIHLLIVITMLWALSIMRWGLVSLICQFLRISYEIRIRLNLFSLAWTSSLLRLIHIELYTLICSTGSSWSWLN